MAVTNQTLIDTSFKTVIESASGGVELIWDATSNVQCVILTGNGTYGYSSGQPALVNNAGSGITGDVLVTNATGTFTLITEFHKVSGYTNTI